MSKPFLDDAKLPKCCAKCFSVSKLSNMVVFLDLSLEKPERLVRETWNLVYRNLRSCLEKKLENNNFLLAAVHCEFDIWNIYKYFINIFIAWISKDIWIWLSWAMFNWSPQFYSLLSAACVNWNCFVGNFYCCRRLFSTRTQIWIESETAKEENIQIFRFEIILSGENGSQRHDCGKILNSKFLKGLRHSALWSSPHTDENYQKLYRVFLLTGPAQKSSKYGAGPIQ